MQIPKEAIEYIYNKNDMSKEFWNRKRINIFTIKEIDEAVVNAFLQWQAENPCWDCKWDEKGTCVAVANHPSNFLPIQDVWCRIKEIREQYKKED